MSGEERGKRPYRCPCTHCSVHCSRSSDNVDLLLLGKLSFRVYLNRFVVMLHPRSGFLRLMFRDFPWTRAKCITFQYLNVR